MGKVLDLIFGKEQLPPATIPLDRAVVCLNCEAVYEINQHPCPKCGSDVWLNLGLALGDEPTKERVRRIACR